MSIDDRTFATASIRELGALIRSGAVTPTELAEHAIARLESDGRRLNAVATITRERALREARRAGEELAAGHDRGPLHGIPYGAKDLLDTAGIATTWGAAPFRDRVPGRDATVIRRLSEAGAVLVAKLAMVELAGGMGYDHPDAAFTGPGLNPWDAGRWSGGSSSGSAAAVGARIVPFAIGSETQGSIITPSTFCGVTGLRPTYGRVSRHGAMALCWTLDKLGPIARSADDCGLVLESIAGPDIADPTAANRTLSWTPETARVAGFRIARLKGATDGIEPEVAANFEAALAVLGEVATIEEAALPDFPYAASTHLIILAEGSAAFDNFIAGGGLAGLQSEADRTTAYAYDAVSARDYLRALRVRQKYTAALDEFCAGYDAVVAPSLPAVAPPVTDSFAGRLRPGVPLVAAGNGAGLPAIAVPDGFGAGGLPTGLQIAGRAFEESRILAVAHAYQQRTTWHLQHPTG